MLNGVLGDHLLASDNPLALSMAIVDKHSECTAQQVAKRWSDTSKKPMLMVHGLCLSEQCWQAPGRHGEMLQNTRRFAPLYLRYNSGLAISDNGRQLSAMLEDISAQMPADQELDILAHSMGGLVVRSALHAAQKAGYNWPKRVDKLVFLGTPHHGAYLEKAGYIAHYLMTISPYSRPFANMAKRRSQGIQDLNSGRITDYGRAIAIPSNIKTYAVASKLRHKKQSRAEHWLGDGLVSVASALGDHHKPHRHLNIAKDRQWTVPNVSHMGLLDDAAIQAHLLDILN
jgi:pimeloyl-ACP methyl ester carboxylesterase